jgi:hypothetical protein
MMLRSPLIVVVLLFVLLCCAAWSWFGAWGGIYLMLELLVRDDKRLGLFGLLVVLMRTRAFVIIVIKPETHFYHNFTFVTVFLKL